MESEKVISIIKNVVSNEIGVKVNEVDMNTQADNVLNSISFIKLIVILESETNLCFNDDELLLGNYNSLNDIATTIIKHLE